jgi:hypothetical protein
MLMPHSRTRGRCFALRGDIAPSISTFIGHSAAHGRSQSLNHEGVKGAKFYLSLCVLGVPLQAQDRLGGSKDLRGQHKCCGVMLQKYKPWPVCSQGKNELLLFEFHSGGSMAMHDLIAPK